MFLVVWDFEDNESMYLWRHKLKFTIALNFLIPHFMKKVIQFMLSIKYKSIDILKTKFEYEYLGFSVFFFFFFFHLLFGPSGQKLNINSTCFLFCRRTRSSVKPKFIKLIFLFVVVATRWPIVQSLWWTMTKETWWVMRNCPILNSYYRKL